jgi:hypothetical protein
MKQIVVYGLCAVVAVEFVAFVLLDRNWLLAVSGVVAALVLLAARQNIGGPSGATPEPPRPSDIEASLERWRIRTATMISRADATQREWDRHLRPLLARQFELATGQHQRTDPARFRATGEMVLGPRLWALVDPDNIAGTDAERPGPGRSAFEEILERLGEI